MLLNPWRNYTESVKFKADLLSALLIAFTLPAYYKVKYFLEGSMGINEILNPWALLEVVYAFILSGILLGFYRLVNVLLPESIGYQAYIRTIVKVGLAALIAISFTRFFFNVVVDWGTNPSFEFDIALLAIMLPLWVSGVADKIFLRAKTEAAEKAALIARFETLKARISPHFLFNSLNTLIDIIEEDRALATRFVEEMASLYRYILEYRDTKLVPLQSEIDAVRSLIFIHETRRPGAINVRIEVNENIKEKSIVPMALQTLVENALKHNTYNTEEPIDIIISINDELLQIENSLNRKKSVISTREGLDNLRKQINFVCDRPLKVCEHGSWFQVSIPLISETH